MKKDIRVTRKIDPDKLVIKDNALIMASYSLSVEEQRLILASIQKAQSQKAPLNANLIKISLTVKEYADIYDVGLKAAYKALSKSSNRLWERSIVIKDEGVQTEIRWLQERAKYESGKVDLTFSSVISKHISEVVTTQTAYRLAQATQLRTQHSIRFFEIFEAVIDDETGEGIWNVTVDELKEILDIKNKYNRWADLRNTVIVPSLLIINKNTSLQADWEISAKIGKKISEIRFIVFDNEQLSLEL